MAIRIAIDSGLRARLKARCALKETTMNDVVNQLISEWLDSEESTEDKK